MRAQKNEGKCVLAHALSNRAKIASAFPNSCPRGKTSQRLAGSARQQHPMVGDSGATVCRENARMQSLTHGL